MMNRIDFHIANTVFTLRQKNDMSQVQLAQLLGLKSRVSINRMEKAQQSFTTKQLYLMACIFKVDVGYFFPDVEFADLVIVKRKVTTEIIEPVFKIKKMPKI